MVVDADALVGRFLLAQAMCLESDGKLRDRKQNKSRREIREMEPCFTDFYKMTLSVARKIGLH